MLVVPFQPDALVTAFIDELFKRIARLDLQLQPDTHIATLHLDSETGAILDCEDLLSDVVGEDKKDKLFMVVKKKDAARESNANEVRSTPCHPFALATLTNSIPEPSSRRPPAR